MLGINFRVAMAGLFAGKLQSGVTLERRTPGDPDPNDPSAPPAAVTTQTWPCEGAVFAASADTIPEELIAVGDFVVAIQLGTLPPDVQPLPQDRITVVPPGRAIAQVVVIKAIPSISSAQATCLVSEALDG